MLAMPTTRATTLAQLLDFFSGEADPPPFEPISAEHLQLLAMRSRLIDEDPAGADGHEERLLDDVDAPTIRALVYEVWLSRTTHSTDDDGDTATDAPALDAHFARLIDRCAELVNDQRDDLLPTPGETSETIATQLLHVIARTLLSFGWGTNELRRLEQHMRERYIETLPPLVGDAFDVRDEREARRVNAVRAAARAARMAAKGAE